jgi:acyl carrier protein
METKERVKKIIGQVLEVDANEIDEETLFAENDKFAFDSIMGLDVLTGLEKEFKIRIGEKYLLRMTSVNNIVKIVEEILAEQPISSK